MLPLLSTNITTYRRGSRGVRRPPLGRRDDPSRRRGFLRLKGRKKGHWCPLNGCSTSFKHNMAINILKSYKSVLAYVKNRSSPIPYKVINTLAPSPGRTPGSAPDIFKLDSKLYTGAHTPVALSWGSNNFRNLLCYVTSSFQIM